MSDVADLLSSADADVREQAFRLLLVRWKMMAYRSAAVQAMESDPSVEVQVVASYGLASTSTSATRTDDISFLSAVVRNDGEVAAVRAAAYDGLLILLKRNAFPDSTRRFDPARDVDWEWLNSIERSELR